MEQAVSDHQLHPTAVVGPRARLAPDVRVGAYAVIEDGAEIGAGCVIGPHAVVHGSVQMGPGNRVGAHAVLGGDPQHLGFDPALATGVRIGADNVFREGVTVNRASLPAAPTTIGSRCYLMNLVHLGHDCSVADGVILATGVALGGHVEIGAEAFLGGGVMVHQFCRIGELAMVRGMAGIGKDVLPFSLVAGNPVQHYRLNLVGLRRAGLAREEIAALQTAFRALRRRQPGQTAHPRPEHDASQPSPLQRLLDWHEAPSRRGLAPFARPTKRREARVVDDG
ncbi:MAG: acyl-ACP--UDP-N-acetylglucosamine O-acyltransferase [Gammaproteobacteria bacterium]|nr:MAG: acyl-ACP--UDP-N-acetylglucosamine O-acyltransferase [Gammaproteobacteria bacterium]